MALFTGKVKEHLTNKAGDVPKTLPNLLNLKQKKTKVTGVNHSMVRSRMA